MAPRQITPDPSATDDAALGVWLIDHGFGSQSVNLIYPDIRAVIVKYKSAPTFDPVAMVADIKATNSAKVSELLNKGAAPKGSGSGASVATKAQQIAASAAAIRNESDTLGLSLSNDQVTAIAKTSVANKWESAQLTDYLTQGLDFTKLRPGTLTGNLEQIKQMAADQLLTISDLSAQNYSRRVSSGELDKNGLMALFQEQARKDYSWAAPAIDKGISMSTYLMPTRDRIAAYLEKTPEAIDMMDPKYLSMMQTVDAKTGLVRAATQSEVMINARSDPDFAKTNAARSMTQSVASAIRSFMGA
jgi:hypothetical protein